MAFSVGAFHNSEVGRTLWNSYEVANVGIVDLKGEDLFTEIVRNEIDELGKIIIGTNLNIV